MRIWVHTRQTHPNVEINGQRRVWAQNMAANEGVPDELVGFLDGIENGDGVREIAEGGE